MKSPDIPGRFTVLLEGVVVNEVNKAKALAGAMVFLGFRIITSLVTVRRRWTSGGHMLRLPG